MKLETFYKYFGYRWSHGDNAVKTEKELRLFLAAWREGIFMTLAISGITLLLIFAR